MTNIAPPGGSRPAPAFDPAALDPDDDESLDDEAGDGEASPTIRTATVPAGLAGVRLDRALADLLADQEAPPLSRSRLKALLDQGRVLGDGRTLTDASCRVKPGQVLTVTVPAPEPATPVAQALPLTVVYEDDDLLVIDKAAGMVVHPAAGNPDGTLVNALLAHCGDRLSGIGGVRRPGIVHRLDKDTSGLMVVAKTDRAHGALSAQFADRSLSRTYAAVVWGVPMPATGRIVTQIGRSPANRQKMAVLAHGGKPAVTNYSLVQGFQTVAALVNCTLETGRTHQIRVHMAHIGHPLIGDPVYGRSREGKALAEPAKSCVAQFARQALHARAIRFIHPASREVVAFSSPLPNDFRELLHSLECL